MMLVGLSGVARSGKDTVGGILVDKLGFERRGFADKLRAVALGADPYVVLDNEAYSLVRLSDLVGSWGWERAKEHGEVRRFLQALGTEGVRENLGYDTWVEAAMPSTRELMNGARIVFTDCRFENEAFAIKVAGGEVWRIVRPGFEAINAHASENGIPDELITRTIFNDGSLADLRRTVLSTFTPE